VISKMRIGGLKVNYQLTCPTRLWLFSNGLSFEHTSPLVNLGKTLHEELFNKETKDIIYDEIAVDVIISRGRRTSSSVLSLLFERKGDTRISSIPLLSKNSQGVRDKTYRRDHSQIEESNKRHREDRRTAYSTRAQKKENVQRLCVFLLLL